MKCEQRPCHGQYASGLIHSNLLHKTLQFANFSVTCLFLQFQFTSVIVVCLNIEMVWKYYIIGIILDSTVVLFKAYNLIVDSLFLCTVDFCDKMYPFIQ